MSELGYPPLAERLLDYKFYCIFSDGIFTFCQNNDIYMYDLGPDGIKDTDDDGGEKQITNAHGTPAIYENTIVWMDNRNDNGDKRNNWDICLGKEKS